MNLVAAFLPLLLLLLHFYDAALSATPTPTPAHTVATVATLRGTFPAAPAVFINGVPAQVVLHNDTAISFRIPAHMVADRHLLATSVVQINTGPRPKNIPLVALEAAFVQVPLADFEDALRNSQTDRERTAAGTASRDGRNGKDGANGADGADGLDGQPGQDGQDGEHGADADDATAYNEQHLYNNEFPDDPDLEYDYEYDDDVDDHSSAEVPGDNTDDHNNHVVNPMDEPTPQHRPPRSADDIDALVARAERILENDPASLSSAIPLLETAADAHHPRAQTALSALLLSGAPGLRRDHARAVSLLRAASDVGHPDAQAQLASLHASGVVSGVRKDMAAALLLWTFAAEGGSMYARMALGYRYFTGTDVAEDCERAAMYYKSVADSVYFASQAAHDTSFADDDVAEIRPPTPATLFHADRKRLTEDMARRVLGEANEVVQYYRYSADRGDPQAQVFMGSLYYYGANDMPQDVTRARRLFEAAAAQGRGDANSHLGFMDLRAGRNETAVAHLEKAARKGDKLGLHGMGYVTLHGIGTKKDASRAAQYFRKAAQKQHPEAMYNLAIMYSKGVGVQRSPEESFRLFEMAAHHGHMQSNYNIGVRYLKGLQPVSKDCTGATQYLKLVAQQGVWNRILSKAFRAYERGDYADALYRYLQAAHAGIELAQYNAAFMYEKNLLSNSDGFLTAPHGDTRERRAAVVEEALQLYSMSASQSSSESLVRMGDLAFGEAQDYSRAAAAYKRAVEMHNAEAMFNLGWMHARGFGMNADRHMAKRYFDQAKDTNDDAVLPATLAVYSLQYSESLHELLDKASFLVERCRRFADLHRGAGSGPWGASGGGKVGPLAAADAVVLTVLLGVLMFVVNARHRRMLDADRELENAGEQRDALDERVAGEVPAAPNLQEQQDTPQHDQPEREHEHEE